MTMPGSYRSESSLPWLLRPLGLAAVVLSLLGLAAIWLGWNGTANRFLPAGQAPYLLSGAALGMAGIVVAALLFVVQEGHESRQRLAAQLDDLLVAMTSAVPATPMGRAVAPAIPLAAPPATSPPRAASPRIKRSAP